MSTSPVTHQQSPSGRQDDPRPQLAPAAFGRDCTVGDRLQVKCLWRAVGEYFYARRGARRLLALRRQVLLAAPALDRRELMVRVAIGWAAISRPDAVSLVKSVQVTFGEWPSPRECTFRDFAVYLLVTDYLRTRCATGTQIDMQHVVAKWIHG